MGPPTCGWKRGCNWIDKDTLARTQHRPPVPLEGDELPSGLGSTSYLDPVAMSEGLLAATVHFATNRWELPAGHNGDKSGWEILCELIDKMKDVLGSRDLRVRFICKGYADVRLPRGHDPRDRHAKNLQLAELRADTVMLSLMLLTIQYPNCSFRAMGFPPSGANASLTLWARDRRVDVFTIIGFSGDELATNIKINSSIFKNYNPAYQRLWVPLGLRHLVEDCERIDLGDLPGYVFPKISGEETTRVLELLRRIRPKEYEYIINGHSDELEQTYWFVYREEWEKAYKGYKAALDVYMQAHPEATKAIEGESFEDKVKRREQIYLVVSSLNAVE